MNKSTNKMKLKYYISFFIKYSTRIQQHTNQPLKPRETHKHTCETPPKTHNHFPPECVWAPLEIYHKNLKKNYTTKFVSNLEIIIAFWGLWLYSSANNIPELVVTMHNMKFSRDTLIQVSNKLSLLSDHPWAVKLWHMVRVSVSYGIL